MARLEVSLGCLRSWPIISFLSRKYLRDTILCQPCCPFLWSILHKFVNENMMRQYIESFPEVKINTHCSPPAHHSQFGEAGLPLFEYVVSTFSRMLTLHMFRNYFQNYFPYRVSMDWGNVALLLVLKTYIFVFLEGKRDIFFFFKSSRTSLKYHNLHYFSWNSRMQL